MKGIILAGSDGLRLFPLTGAMNPYLLPVGKYPMIYYPLERFKKAGIREILIVAGREALGPIIGQLGGGSSFGLNFYYQVQEKNGGILEALGQAADFVRREHLLVCFGDQIFRDDLSGAAASFLQQTSGVRVFLKEISDPDQQGIAPIQSNPLAQFREKPSNLTPNLWVTGIYMFDAQVFDIIQKFQRERPLAGAGLDITDLINAYPAGAEVHFEYLRDWWVQVESFQTLELANELARDVELEFEA